MKKTKIVCTLGPATDSREKLKAMIEAGMNVARFNFSHGTHEQHRDRYLQLREVAEQCGKSVAALLDTKGPEIRVKKFKNGKIMVKHGQTFTFTTREVEGTENIVSVTYQKFPLDVLEGMTILVDDGLIAMVVMEKNEEDVVCKVLNDGVISDHKGVNIPGAHLSMPFISQKDREDIMLGVKLGVDFIATSFTRSAKDVLAVKEILQECNAPHIEIIAKIENSEGVENIDEIIGQADGVMIARGDMGVEIPNEDVPILQKIIIKKVVQAGKKVITATQMLDSMMKNPRPTRAETTDVANAIYDGSSAVMLSGETAAGLYPVEAVKTMARIIERTEQAIDYRENFQKRFNYEKLDITQVIARATCLSAHDLEAKAIIAVTKSGRTARAIETFRPGVPIISCTTSETVYRHLSLSWGVYPLLISEEHETFLLLEHAVEAVKNAGYVQTGDTVVITTGIPLGISGTTNLIKVHVVGEDMRQEI